MRYFACALVALLFLAPIVLGGCAGLCGDADPGLLVRMPVIPQWSSQGDPLRLQPAWQRGQFSAPSVAGAPGAPCVPGS